MDDLIFDVGIDNEFVDVGIGIGAFRYSEFLNRSEAEALANYLQHVATEIVNAAKVVKYDHNRGVKHDNAE